MPAFLTSLLACIPKWIEQAEYHYNEVSLQVKPEHLQPVLRFLRDHTQTQFKVFIDLCGVDYPAREKRFERNFASGRTRRTLVFVETHKRAPENSRRT